MSPDLQSKQQNTQNDYVIKEEMFFVMYFCEIHNSSACFYPQTSIDILTTVVRNTKPPLSELLVCQAFPVVAQCTLRTDDNTIMQVKSFPL